ncbi:uncharacterized protein DNG_08513 [Cephalotrichum gorgonifer]|uniref:Senescence domain-containing protein n=1 Tax=Cephalotrichum gorgonifer TaxID=2041049 RepID=A0AAE8N3P2_9PEZI|nr:uncharacterized protein DNG_08513 [Cephalotrichum gorgonifer]
MSGAQHDPKLLYAIEDVKAYHIADGKEVSLTPSGGQTLSLLMVPTSSPFADASNIGAVENDFYLHLHLPPELDLPLPATTQIYHQPPSSYLIPRWDLGPDSGAFTRIEFPRAGSRPGLQEDVDTFETILAQCTAFLERAPPPRPSKVRGASSKAAEAAGEELPAYNPADYAPGEGYAEGSRSSHPGGRIVLINEEDGSVLGELGGEYQIQQHSDVKPGSKDPVEFSFPTEGNKISVLPAPPDYVEKSVHPAYKKSTMVTSATKASRLIVTTSNYISKTMQSQADSFTKNTKPNPEPVTFTPAAHDRIRRINTFSTKAAGFSAATVGQIGRLAQNVGAGLARKKSGGGRGYDADGNPIETYKPGLLNKSLMAFNTVIDGVEQAGANLLGSTSASVSTVVGHRWGSEAGEVATNVTSGFKNVGLVYIDVTGVSRRAVLKGVAKGMVVGKVANGGGDLVVGGGDGGSFIYPTDDKSAAHGKNGSGAASSASSLYEGNGKKAADGRYA